MEVVFFFSLEAVLVTMCKIHFGFLNVIFFSPDGYFILYGRRRLTLEASCCVKRVGLPRATSRHLETLNYML